MASEIVTRRRLLHWYRPGYAHFVTYRLAGSIPDGVSRQWRDERSRLMRQADSLPYDARAARLAEIERQFFKQYDDLLDRSGEMKWLADARVASVVRENLYHHNGSKYQLIAYCVMPNHVHVVLQPHATAAADVGQAASLPPEATKDAPAPVEPISDEIRDSASPLTDIMHSLKSYTANQANKVLGRQGTFWQHESYDHWVRDLDQLERIANYIRSNPVRAGLCKKPADWQFSSACDRFQRDGSDSALVGWLRDDWKR